MHPPHLPYAQGFRDLIVYQKQRQLAREVFTVTKAFPGDERYSLTDQLRRASRSVGAQIAEAWAKRRYEKHFIAKLTDADGEQMETQHWLETAVDCGYLQRDACHRLVGACEEIGRMLGSMIGNAPTFCGDLSALREEPVEYFCSLSDAPFRQD